MADSERLFNGVKFTIEDSSRKGYFLLGFNDAIEYLPSRSILYPEAIIEYKGNTYEGPSEYIEGFVKGIALYLQGQNKFNGPISITLYEPRVLTFNKQERMKLLEDIHYSITGLFCSYINFRRDNILSPINVCTSYGQKICSNLVRVAATRIFDDRNRAIAELVANSIDAYSKGSDSIGRFGMGFFSIFSFLDGIAEKRYIPGNYIQINSFKLGEKGFTCIIDTDHQGTIRFKLLPLDMETLGRSHGTDIIVVSPTKQISVTNARYIFTSKFRNYSKVLVSYNPGGPSPLDIRWKDTLYGYDGSNGIVDVVHAFYYINTATKNYYLQVSDAGVGISKKNLLESMLIPSSSTKGLKGKRVLKQLVNPSNIVDYRVLTQENNIFSILVSGVSIVELSKRKDEVASSTTEYILSLPDGFSLPVARNDVLLDKESHKQVFLEQLKLLSDLSIKRYRRIDTLFILLREYAKSSNNGLLVNKFMDKYISESKLSFVPKGNDNIDDLVAIGRCVYDRIDINTATKSLLLQYPKDDNIYVGVDILRLKGLSKPSTFGTNLLFIPSNYKSDDFVQMENNYTEIPLYRGSMVREDLNKALEFYKYAVDYTDKEQGSRGYPWFMSAYNQVVTIEDCKELIERAYNGSIITSSIFQIHSFVWIDFGVGVSTRWPNINDKEGNPIRGLKISFSLSDDNTCIIFCFLMSILCVLYQKYRMVYTFDIPESYSLGSDKQNLEHISNIFNIIIRRLISTFTHGVSARYPFLYMQSYYQNTLQNGIESKNWPEAYKFHMYQDEDEVIREMRVYPNVETKNTFTKEQEYQSEYESYSSMKTLENSYRSNMVPYPKNIHAYSKDIHLESTGIPGHNIRFDDILRFNTMTRVFIISTMNTRDRDWTRSVLEFCDKYSYVNAMVYLNILRRASYENQNIESVPNILEYLDQELFTKYSQDIIYRTYENASINPAPGYILSAAIKSSNISKRIYDPMALSINNYCRIFILPIQVKNVVWMIDSVPREEDYHKFTVQQLVHYLCNFEPNLRGSSGSNWMLELRDYPYTSNIQSLDIVVESGTTRKFVVAALTELVQNSLDAIRDYRLLADIENLRHDTNEIKIGLGTNDQQELVLTVQDNIGISDSGIYSILIPFLSSKSDVSTGEMGTGFFTTLLPSGSRHVIIETCNGERYLRLVLQYVNSDVQVSCYTEKSELFGTKIQVAFRENITAVDYVSNYSYVYGFCKDFLSYDILNNYYVNEQIGEKCKLRILYQDQYVILYKIDEESEGKRLSSIVTTNDVPYNYLDNFLTNTSSLSSLVDPLIMVNIRLEIRKKAYTPTQSRDSLKFTNIEGVSESIQVALYTALTESYRDNPVMFNNSITNFIHFGNTLEVDLLQHNPNLINKAIFAIYGTYISDIYRSKDKFLIDDDFVNDYARKKNISPSNKKFLRYLLVGKLISSSNDGDHTVDLSAKPIATTNQEVLNTTTFTNFMDLFSRLFWKYGRANPYTSKIPGFAMHKEHPKVTVKPINSTAIAFYSGSDHKIVFSENVMNIFDIFEQCSKLVSDAIEFYPAQSFSSILVNKQLLRSYFNTYITNAKSCVIIHELCHAWRLSPGEESHTSAEYNIDGKGVKMMDFNLCAQEVYRVLSADGLVTEFVTELIRQPITDPNWKYNASA